jgi:phosphoenolpyruvate synthase/pyruvate phosphate dikinase
MDERIDAFLKDMQELEGVDANTIRDGVRSYLAVYENLVRDTETELHKRDEAAQAWHKLCRERVAEEVAQRAGTPAGEHWKLVLSVIDSAARSPLKN